MKYELQPIETKYKGYRFRSLLEARWAVFLDAAGVSWVYEPQGFDLDGVWYLPDFYLPELKLYLEIKPNPGDLDSWPEHPMFDWQRKHEEGGEVRWGGDWRFALLQGDPWVEGVRSSFSGDVCVHGHEHTIRVADDYSYNIFIWGDCYYRWCECPCCGKVGISFDGRAARLCKCFPVSDKTYNSASPRLVLSFESARAFRPGR